MRNCAYLSDKSVQQNANTLRHFGVRTQWLVPRRLGRGRAGSATRIWSYGARARARVCGDMGSAIKNMQGGVGHQPADDKVPHEQIDKLLEGLVDLRVFVSLRVKARRPWLSESRGRSARRIQHHQ